MQVPNRFAKAHLDLVNGLYGISESLKNLRSLFTDPILALEGMRRYQESAKLYFSARQAISEYLLYKKINYKQGTGGYYLMYGI